MCITQRVLSSVNEFEGQTRGVQARRWITRAVERSVDVVVVKQPSRVVQDCNAVDASSKDNAKSRGLLSENPGRRLM